jgi:hypothetical protein
MMISGRIMQASHARLETMALVDYRHWRERGWLEAEAVYLQGNVRANWLFDRAA